MAQGSCRSDLDAAWEQAGRGEVPNRQIRLK
jgi:hypothetical protein